MHLRSRIYHQNLNGVREIEKGVYNIIAREKYFIFEIKLLNQRNIIYLQLAL